MDETTTKFKVIKSGNGDYIVYQLGYQHNVELIEHGYFSEADIMQLEHCATIGELMQAYLAIMMR